MTDYSWNMYVFVRNIDLVDKVTFHFISKFKHISYVLVEILDTCANQFPRNV